MIKKILIANRGEIALRVVRAAAELGIISAAVFTEADRYALHVKQADEAYSLGPDTHAYLNVEQIVELAQKNKCDAIHPGYGFLSENPTLGALCRRKNIIFIGPSPNSMKLLGDKLQAKKALSALGIPVLPGSLSNLVSLAEALSCAESVGYPVMLKATNGGGGRGIRMCRDANELEQNYPRVISEVTKAFGEPEIFLEKFIANPRHIEVQVLADKFGNVVHLYERDCSIQRRNQKLIEIAPSPQLTITQRQYICDLAVKATRCLCYENAGTLEFLLDNNGNFYFLEMNTRLQVEHTISEQITGIDIVQEQIRIASGEKLSCEQTQIQMRGFAAQFRINAEDPMNNFLPSFGRITRYYAPGGPGVRTDSAIYTGYTLPPYYDSLCAKLTVWALNWERLLPRAARALREMKLYGVKTTIPFYLEILQMKDFVKAKFDTGFIAQHQALLRYDKNTAPHHLATALGAAIAVYRGV